MSQPWLTFALLFAAGWLAYGLHISRIRMIRMGAIQ